VEKWVSPRTKQSIEGVRVLVVEDDTLVAMDLKETLVEASAIVVDVCQTLDEGMARANDDDFAVAVLSLGPDTASPLARRLVRRGSSVHSLYGAVPPRTEPG
jgi:DNA-binding response OmpR family regulator